MGREIWSAPKPKIKTKKTCEQCGKPADCCVDVYEETENPNRYQAVKRKKIKTNMPVCVSCFENR